MCLIFLSYRQHEKYRLVFGANRDEFYARPTAPADFWEDAPQVLAGRDIRGGGTWMGITRNGRFAAITNYRDPASVRENAPSRGLIVSDFLTGNQSVEEYGEQLSNQGGQYNGFNLLFGDRQRLYYYSNKRGEPEELNPGVYGLSNRFLDTPWHKVKTGTARFREIIAQKEIEPEAIFELLSDTSRPPDEELPDTGVGIEWERLLSPLFVSSRTYGTRSSTVLLADMRGEVGFWERTFVRDDNGISRYETRNFRFTQESGIRQPRP